MDPTGRKREEDGAEGYISAQDRGSERSMVLRGIFGPKRVKERGGWC